MTEKNCVFCASPAINAREIVRNKFAKAFLTNIPIVVGHVLIAPIRCVTKFEDLSEEEIKSIFRLRKLICDAHKKTFGAEGFNFAWNEGALAGQSVPHFHLHVVPRKIGDTGITKNDPRKFLYRTGRRRKTPENELRKVGVCLKKHISTK